MTRHDNGLTGVGRSEGEQGESCIFSVGQWKNGVANIAYGECNG